MSLLEPSVLSSPLYMFVIFTERRGCVVGRSREVYGALLIGLLQIIKAGIGLSCAELPVNQMQSCCLQVQHVQLLFHADLSLKKKYRMNAAWWYAALNLYDYFILTQWSIYNVILLNSSFITFLTLIFHNNPLERHFRFLCYESHSCIISTKQVYSVFNVCSTLAVKAGCVIGQCPFCGHSESESIISDSFERSSASSGLSAYSTWPSLCE